MALRDEQADILGGPILQRPESGLFTTFSRYHFVFKSVTYLGLGLLVWIVCARGLEHLKKHRELRYRKAMRRKHGIPDSDCRPFAVAYAAAKRAHLEREAQDRKKTTNYVSDHNLPAVDQRTDPQDPRGLRRRVPETTVRLHDHQLPGRHAVAYDNIRPKVHSLDFVDRYNPNPHRRVTVPEPWPVERSPIRRASRKDLVINTDNNEESRKRSFEDENDVEHEAIKKSRIDGDEPIDGDEQADWYAQYGDLPPRRASKESLGRQPADNYVFMDGRERSKRISDLRDEDREPVDEAMEGITEDEATELKAVARGKKRGRVEAGSTFGGDDDDDTRTGKVSHHRKRRTILRRKIEVPARGQKRDREAESPESEGEGGGSETSRRPVLHSSKKKRGKKVVSDEASEISAEDSRVSEDPLCNGRRVGDEWEVDGVQYKVGDKGERLRLTLVKKARNKYHMPQDSRHPDRSAALEIYVETWMTDGQYKQAEGRQELAWQEAPGSKTPDVLDSPTKNGKNLLWDSVRGSPARRPFRQFMPAGASSRFNPFEQWQLQPTLGRRVASSSTIVSPILLGVADSPARPGFRGFSKWEKQDREAEALARIRAKIEEQKKAQVPSQKSAETPTSVTAPELDTKTLSIPTITLTPAPVVPAEGGPNNGIPQSKSNTLTSFLPTPPGTGDSIKGGAAPASSTTASGFSLPSASMPAATPSTLFSGVLTAPTTTSSTVSPSPFSFAKPLQIPVSTSTIASSPAIPNPFEKGTTAGTPPTSTLSPSTLGATTQPQPPLIESGSKLGPSSFAKPDTSSSIPSPAAVAPPTTKSQASSLGATSSSYPSSVTFGSSPAAAKAEAPVPPPVSTTTTAFESSRTTVPLFSFSGTSSSSFTATHPTSSASSAPKFSFGQPPTTPTFMPSSNLASGTASQPKPTFKFGQTPPGATDGDSASTVPAADEPKKPAAPVSVFGIATGTNEPVKPSPFGTTSAFGASPSALATNFSGRPVAVGGALTSTPPNPTLTSASTTTLNSILSSTPAGAPAPGNTPMFSFGGPNSGSKPAEGSKPVSLFGGATGGSNPVPAFGSNSTEKKPTFTFSASAEASKPPISGRSAEGSRPTFTFGGSAETSKSSVFGGTVEGSKSTFAFSGVTENKSTSGLATEISKSSDTTDILKPTSAPGTTLGPSSSALAFMFGEDDPATNTPTSMATQPKLTAPFTFGGPSGGTGSMFGQSSILTTSGDSNQPIFGKPTDTTPSAFGFVGAGSSGSSSTFTFGKPAAQNQKQEQ